MRDLIVFAAAGFAASLVDGALGMGFGPTSSSILLGAGLAPAAVSASVNIAKVATGIVAAISHWRFKNIDKRLVMNLALPGMLGAIAGVTILSSVDGKILRPILAALLTVVGVRILFRFARLATKKDAAPDSGGDPDKMPAFDQRGVKLSALIGGVTNGMIGAWGPVVTPFLLHRGVKPRFAIGSVNTAEVAVASASAFSLIGAMGKGGLSPSVIIAMLAGGIIAAPVAAWLIRYIPPKPMGVAVAALLLLTNARELASWAGLGKGPWVWAIYAGIVALVTLVVFGARLRRAPLGASEPTPVANAAPGV